MECIVGGFNLSGISGGIGLIFGGRITRVYAPEPCTVRLIKDFNHWAFGAGSAAVLPIPGKRIVGPTSIAAIGNNCADTTTMATIVRVLIRAAEIKVYLGTIICQINNVRASRTSACAGGVIAVGLVYAYVFDSTSDIGIARRAPTASIHADNHIATSTGAEHHTLPIGGKAVGTSLRGR